MVKRIAAAAAAAVVLASPAGVAAERSDRMVMAGPSTKPVGTPVTAQQRRMLAEKLALVDRAMQSAANGRELAADHRMWLLETMYRMPVAELRAIAPDIGHDSLVKVVTKAAKSPAKLGTSNSSELVYFPITPCRYADTRNVGGPLTGTPRPFNLANTGTTYGGSGACDPKAAIGGNEDLIGAIAINVTIISPTAAPGFIGARPAGSTATTSLVNWYNAGAGVQAANAGVVTTDQTAAANEIEFFGSPTQFIVDVFGVFASPTATALDCMAGTETSVNVNASSPAARNFNLAADACPGGYAMVSNSCQASGDYAGGNVILAAQGAGVGITTSYASNCAGYYAGSSTTPAAVTIYNAPWCCRIPGR